MIRAGGSLVACPALGGWSMDAPAFPRTSSAPRPVPLGRAVEKHRRKGGGAIDQPKDTWLLTNTKYHFKVLRLICSKNCSL